MSSKDLTIEVQPRTERGNGCARRARRQGRIPAVIYGHSHRGEPLSVDENALTQVIHHSGLLQMSIAGEKTVSAIVKEVQRDCISGRVLHVDFQEVRADEVVTITIQIDAVGTPIGTQAGGQLEQVLRQVDVKLKARDMFDSIKVDVSHLELNAVLHVRDLKFPEGVTPVIDLNASVFQVRLPKVEEEVTPEAAVAEGEAAVEPEVITKGKKAEEGEEEAGGAEAPKGGKEVAAKGGKEAAAKGGKEPAAKGGKEESKEKKK
jgi:large subunit ribosomal protein L25